MTRTDTGSPAPAGGDAPAGHTADVSLRHLYAFLAVADTLSFTRAAHRLASNQPALTRSIRRLEAQMGVRLFERTTRSVALSSAGARLRTELRTLLPRFENALRPDAARPALRLGFSWLLPDGWVHETIARFEQETGTRVELRRRDDPWAGADQGAVDVGIVRVHTRQAGMHAVRKSDEAHVVAVPESHPLTRLGRPHWSDLGRYPMVLNTVTGSVAEQDWEEAHRPQEIVRCLNFDECIESVAAGKGISPVPDLVLRRNIHPSVRFLPVLDAPRIDVTLVRPTHNGHPLAGRFIEAALRAPALAFRDR